MADASGDSSLDREGEQVLLESIKAFDRLITGSITVEEYREQAPTLGEIIDAHSG